MNEVTVKGIETLDELNGFEVVRTDIISAYHKAKITLDYDAIKFSKACLDLFPENEFVQVLIDRVQKRIVLLPCDKYTKDALKWCSTKDGKHISRDCTARIFGAKVFDMMSWIKDNRYKSIAIYQELQGTRLIIFNLYECEMSVPEYFTRDDGKKVKRNKTFLPGDWRDAFGLTLREHSETIKVDLNSHYLMKERVDDGKKPPVAGKQPNDEEVIMSQYREETPDSDDGAA